MYFKQIDGCENLYVSRDGYVHSFRRKIPVILKGAACHSGHLRIYTNKNGQQKTYIHRLVAQAFIPNPEDKPFINHKDGNPKNNKVSNLEWCTASENSLHQYHVLKKDTLNSLGEDNINAKLKARYIPSIRKLIEEGIPCSQISWIFGVDSSTIKRVKWRHTWKHV